MPWKWSICIITNLNFSKVYTLVYTFDNFQSVALFTTYCDATRWFSKVSHDYKKKKKKKRPHKMIF